MGSKSTPNESFRDHFPRDLNAMLRRLQLMRPLVMTSWVWIPPSFLVNSRKIFSQDLKMWHLLWELKAVSHLRAHLSAFWYKLKCYWLMKKMSNKGDFSSWQWDLISKLSGSIHSGQRGELFSLRQFLFKRYNKLGLHPNDLWISILYNLRARIL